MTKTAWKTPVAHTTLTLSQICPTKSAAFSPNLHKWMRRHAHFFKEGGVMDTVFRVRPEGKLAESFGPGTLLIGQAYAQYKGDADFSGVRLMAALCQGADAGRFCYIGAMNGLEELKGFWDGYLKVGRCAIDPEHREHFMGDRFRMDGDTRTCLWCGAKHERVLTPRTVFDESWQSV